MARRRVLLTGATGFVGRHLYPALLAAGWDVRCASRDPLRARAALGERDWVAMDTSDPASLRGALEGCETALYLIHSMGSGEDYAEREQRAAAAFGDAASAAGVGRIVYMGAVRPAGEPSAHIASRLETGERLRAGDVPVVELRGGMIVGAGSESWLMVRDLARRLPAMILPRWLRNRSQPVAIDDVVAALCCALEMPLDGPVVLDVPGPEVLSHKQLLQRVSGAFDRHPLMIDVPVLTPRLSSYWIFLFTRARPGVARELVEGLISDLVSPDDGIFERLPGHVRVPLDEAIALALLDEKSSPAPGEAAVERIVARARLALEALRA